MTTTLIVSYNTVKGFDEGSYNDDRVAIKRCPAVVGNLAKDICDSLRVYLIFFLKEVTEAYIYMCDPNDGNEKAEVSRGMFAAVTSVLEDRSKITLVSCHCNSGAVEQLAKRVGCNFRLSECGGEETLGDVAKRILGDNPEGPKERAEKVAAQAKKEEETPVTIDGLVQMLETEFARIHDNGFRSPEIEPVDKQCNDRFGCDWATIRDQVFHDLEAMSRWNTHIDDIAFRGTTGHWMINKLTLVWMLRKRLRQVSLEVPENHYGFGGRLDMERRLESLLTKTGKPELSDLFYIAPILAFDQAKAVIESHGLTV